MTLRGRLTLEQALTRLLAGAPCAWAMADGRTVRIYAETLKAAPPPAQREVASAVPLVAEVTITATKRRQSGERLAAGISVLPAEQLSATGAADAGDTTGQAAGMVMTNLGPGRDKLLMRGLSDGAFTGRARSTVGTYLDDAPINYNAPDPDLRLVDVDRVEVVRGPQGALYGAGSLSGVYRIVTRKPDLDAWRAGARASYASTTGGSPSRVAEGYASVPIVSGLAAMRGALYREVQGGYIDDVNLRQSNVDRTVREGGRLAMRLQPNDSWTIDLSSAAQRLRSRDTQYSTMSPGRRRANRIAEAHKNDFGEVGLHIEGDLGWADVASSTAYVRHNFQSQYDASAAVGLFSEEASDLGVYSEVARVKMTVQDLVLTSRGTGPLSWLAGVYAADTTEDTPSTLSVRSGDQLAAIYQERRRDRVSEGATYGEAAWDFGGGWSAALGGRLFWTKLKARSQVQAPRGPRTLFRTSLEQGLSPKVSLQKDLGDGRLVYGLVSAGYRPGGVNSAGLGPPSSALASFTADKLRNYEVGAKFTAADGRLAARGSAFLDLWRDIQSDQFFPSGLSYTANIGDVRLVGLETELSYDFDFGLSVKANALLSHARLQRSNPALRVALNDSLPGAPSVSGGLIALYERPLTGPLSLRLVGEAAYIGRSSVTFDAATSPRMGDYVRAKLSVELMGPWWTADLYVLNPANESGDTFAYGNPFSFGQVRQVTPQRPRTAGLVLTAAF